MASEGQVHKGRIAASSVADGYCGELSSHTQPITMRLYDRAYGRTNEHSAFYLVGVSLVQKGTELPLAHDRNKAQHGYERY